MRFEAQRIIVGAGAAFKVNLPHRGRVLVDAENFDVLQIELWLVEEFEFESPRVMSRGRLGRFWSSRKLRFRRSEHVVRFRRVQFREPDETLLLPEATETLTVIEGTKSPRRRVTQTFTDYRRFISDVKIIDDDGPHE